MGNGSLEIAILVRIINKGCFEGVTLEETRMN